MLNQANAFIKKWEDAIALSFLLGIGFLITKNLSAHMDVLLWDEARYLDRGFWLWQAYPKTLSPLYSVWYKILSYINSDKIELYYLNYKILSIGTSLLAYIFLRRYKVQSFVAFYLSALWLLHQYNLPSWPKVSHFAIALFFIAGIVTTFTTSRVAQLLIFCTALLLSAFARPELYVAFVLLFFVLCYFLFKDRKQLRKIDFMVFAVFILCFSFTYLLYKTPFTSGDTSRGSFAFVQHFAMNYVSWTKSDLVFWYEWPEVLQKCFPPPYNIKTIVFNADSYLWKHIFYNIEQLFLNIGILYGGLLLPLSFFKTNFLLSLLCGFILISIVLINKIRFRNIIRQFQSNYILMLFLLISTLPVFLSSIYAMPRIHYMVLLMPFAITTLAFFLNNPSQKLSGLLICIGLLFLIFAPKSNQFKYFDMFGKNEGQMISKTIRFIEHKYPNDSLLILDMDGGLPSLMSSNYTSYSFNSIFQDDSTRLSDLLLEKQPDIIFVTKTMKTLKVIQNDTLFQKMLLNPEKYSYTKQKTGNFDSYLLIRNSKN